MVDEVGTREEEKMSGYPAGGSASNSAPQNQIAGATFVALLIFTQLPGVLSYTIPLPLLAEMAKDLAHDSTSEYLVKLISGVIGPAMALGSLAGGLLADRVDRRWLVMALAVTYVLTALAPFAVYNLEIIVATRCLVGVAAGALMAIGFTMVGDYLPEDKRTGTIGMMSALNMVTSLISMPAAGFVAEGGWRPAFLLYLAMVPLVVLASPRALPVPRKVVDPDTLSEPVKARRFNMPWGLLLLSLAVGIILTIPGIYVSFHLATVGLGKTSTVAMLMMGNSLMAAVFSAIFGRASARHSWSVIFSIAFSTMAAGLVMFAFAPGIWLVIPGLLLMGLGMGWLAPGMPALAVASVEEGRRGTIVGAVQGASSAAPLLGISLFEPLAPHIGTVGIMLLVGCLSGILFLGFAFGFGDRRKHRPAREGPEPRLPSAPRPKSFP
jgi:MFS family permease